VIENFCFPSSCECDRFTYLPSIPIPGTGFLKKFGCLALQTYCISSLLHHICKDNCVCASAEKNAGKKLTYAAGDILC